jgi:hypothetical protein
VDGLQAINASVVGLGLADVDSKSEGNDVGNMSVGTEDTDGNTQRLAEKAHRLETLLVVGSSTTNEDPDLVGDQLVPELLEGADDTLEGGSDIGKVGNTSTDDEDLSLWVGGATSDKID